jgi:hypothetical protein
MSAESDVSNCVVSSSTQQLEKARAERHAKLERVRKELIAMVMRQTDYDETTAVQKLEEHKGNFDSVIRDYLVGTSVVEPPSEERSINQRMFGEIRSYMDEASSAYYRKKEAMELRQQMFEAAQKEKDESQ